VAPYDVESHAAPYDVEAHVAPYDVEALTDAGEGTV
jgi:hypothetical protein